MTFVITTQVASEFMDSKNTLPGLLKRLNSGVIGTEYQED